MTKADICSHCSFILYQLEACPLTQTQINQQNSDNFVNMIMVASSVLPYILVFVVLVQCMRFKSFRAFILLTLQVITLIVAQLMKLIFKQQRPEAACTETYGFPSGHAMTTVALTFFIILEYFVLPNKAKFKFYSGNDIFLFLILFSCPFVLYSRLYLFYHTQLQVVVGSVVGVIVAVILFVVVYNENNKIKILRTLDSKQKLNCVFVFVYKNFKLPNDYIEETPNYEFVKENDIEKHKEENNYSISYSSTPPLSSRGQIQNGDREQEYNEMIKQL